MKISTSNAPQYQWGDGCSGWHFVNTPGLSVIRESMPAGTSEVRHQHARSRQFFFVLAGQATIEVNGELYELVTGEGLEISPNVAHQIFNRSQDPLDFIVVSQPHSHGDRQMA